MLAFGFQMLFLSWEAAGGRWPREAAPSQAAPHLPGGLGFDQPVTLICLGFHLPCAGPRNSRSEGTPCRAEVFSSLGLARCLQAL